MPWRDKKERDKNGMPPQAEGTMADNMKHISLVMTFLLALVSGCSAGKDGDRQKGYSENRTRMEAEAQHRLAAARGQLAHGQADAAKRTIEQMRSDCYLALDGRAEGILLMDSVDLFLAKTELEAIDSLMRAADPRATQERFEEACRKVQFYERKIQYDRSR